MFSDIFPILLFLILSVVIKSLNDKKEIENKKYNRPNINEVQVEQQSLIKKREQKVEIISFDKVEGLSDISANEEENEEENKKDRYYEKLFGEEDIDSVDNYKLQVEILKDTKIDKKHRKDIKKDIITGIVFSEILSKPKSMKNNRIR